MHIDSVVTSSLKKDIILNIILVKVEVHHLLSACVKGLKYLISILTDNKCTLIAIVPVNYFVLVLSALPIIRSDIQPFSVFYFIFLIW